MALTFNPGGLKIGFNTRPHPGLLPQEKENWPRLTKTSRLD